MGKTSYQVTWRRRGHEPSPARLAFDATSVVLTATDPSVHHEIPFDEIVGVELRHPAGEPNSIVVIESSTGDVVELETRVDRWIVAALVEHLLVRGLGRPGRQRILLALRLAPGAHDTVRQLLQGGPPFNPDQTPLMLHEAYLLDDEAFFVFETDADVESFVMPDLWQAADRWRELIEGARLAERVYSWSREDRNPRWHHGPGLGF